MEPESYIWWIVFYILDLLFWCWIIFWGGASWLEGTFKSGFLLSTFAPRWSTDGIRLFAWLSLIVSTLWFIAGLFSPDFRILV